MLLAHTILIAIKDAVYIARLVATEISVTLPAIKFTGESGCCRATCCDYAVGTADRRSE
jgi:hypothetical protein